jgi:succinoglycan biosynthesis protein ExoA
LGHHPDSFIYSSQQCTVPAHSVAVAYRRSVFDFVGLFDETFDACEDVELNHRVDQAGLNCLFVPSLRLRYYPRTSLPALFQQMARYGRGRIRLLRKHKSTFSIKTLLPALFLAFLGLGSVAFVALPILLVPYLAVVSLYLSILLGFSIRISLQASQPKFLWLLPLVFMAIHLGAGYGSLMEFLLGHSASSTPNRRMGDGSAVPDAESFSCQETR